MTSIDDASSVSAHPASVARPSAYNAHRTKPAIEAVDTFERLVSAEDSSGNRAESVTTGVVNKTESSVTVEDIRDALRDQIIKDLITKHTNFQL